MPRSAPQTTTIPRTANTSTFHEGTHIQGRQMASLALYRKYRPQTFAEVIGQEHVTRTLRNALQDGRVVHAYLFAGPRGTGKTTTARLLAKAVNCLEEDLAARPCNRCAICQAINEGHLLDLIEIDAASNRGIDEIREIRERVNFRPNEARYKVYVVDEVHMLTEHAFNALLKTLEEPPPHAIFVLATTDPQKVPATVLSRCQRFDFRRVSLGLLVEHLRKIAGAEGVEVEPAALELIARQATGSVRDAVSLLDQLFAFCEGRVTVKDVETVLGAVPGEVVRGVVDALLARDVAQALRLVDDLAHGGTELAHATRALVEYLRGMLLLRVGGEARLLNRSSEEVAAMREQAGKVSAGELVRWVRIFQGAVEEMKGDLLPQIPLELACVEACLGAQPMEETAAPQPPRATGQPPGAQEAPRRPAPAAEPAAAQPKEAAPPPPEAEPRPVPPAQPSQPTAAGPAMDAAALKAEWGRVLAEVRPHSRQVEAVLRGSCEPLSIEDGVVTIGFYHQFHKGRVEEARNRELVQEAVSRVLGAPHRIRCVLVSRGASPGGTGPKPQRKSAPSEAPAVPADEESKPAAPAEAKGGDLDAAYKAVASDPLIQEAVTRYGAQVVDIVSASQGPGEAPGGGGEGSRAPQEREDDGES